MWFTPSNSYFVTVTRIKTVDDNNSISKPSEFGKVCTVGFQVDIDCHDQTAEQSLAITKSVPYQGESTDR